MTGKAIIRNEKITLPAGSGKDVSIPIPAGSTLFQYSANAGADTDCPSQFIRVSFSTGYAGIYLPPLFVRSYNQSFGSTSQSVILKVPQRVDGATITFKARNYSADAVDQSFSIHYTEAPEK